MNDENMIKQARAISQNFIYLHCNYISQYILTSVLSTASSDFEDMSCEMVYGQVPPPLEEDPVSTQPCLAEICKPL